MFVFLLSSSTDESNSSSQVVTRDALDDSSGHGVGVVGTTDRRHRGRNARRSGVLTLVGELLHGGRGHVDGVVVAVAVASTVVIIDVDQARGVAGDGTAGSREA